MKGFFERIRPYGKHNIYIKTYELDEHKSVSISDAKWIVCSYEGYKDGVGTFNPHPDGKADIVALILNDEEKQFFPVISFLTREEALKLSIDLLKFATGRREKILIEHILRLVESD